MRQISHLNSQLYFFPLGAITNNKQTRPRLTSVQQSEGLDEDTESMPRLQRPNKTDRKNPWRRRTCRLQVLGKPPGSHPVGHDVYLALRNRKRLKIVCNLTRHCKQSG